MNAKSSFLSFLLRWFTVLATAILAAWTMHEVDYHPALRREIVHNTWLGLGLLGLLIIWVVSVALAHSKGHKHRRHAVWAVIITTAALTALLTNSGSHLKWPAILAALGLVFGTLFIAAVHHFIEAHNRDSLKEVYHRVRPVSTPQTP